MSASAIVDEPTDIPSTTLVAVAASSSSTALVAKPVFDKNQLIAKLMEMEKAADDLMQGDEYMRQFWGMTNSVPISAINAGLIDCIKNPDQSVLLWSRSRRNNLHCLDLNPAKIGLKRTEAKKLDPVTKKNVGTGDFYVNLKHLGEQSDLEGNDLFGLHQISCFCTPSFLRHGNTVESGIEGNRGRVINGSAVSNGAEQYQHNLSVKWYNHSIKDENGANPVANESLDRWNKMADAILVKAVKDESALSQAKGALRSRLKGQKETYPPEPEDVAAALKANGFFKGKITQEDEDDIQTRSIGLGVSCYRKPGKKEDLSGYKPPSPMFQLNEYDQKQQLQIHNDIPLYRCRRADEVVKGYQYSSPFIRVPSANAVVDGMEDVIAVVYKVNVYEWKLDKAGITNKPVAYIWLNKRSELKQMTIEDIKGCDPRFAVPMAGHYRGPLGWEGTPPANGALVAAASSSSSSSGDKRKFDEVDLYDDEEESNEAKKQKQDEQESDEQAMSALLDQVESKSK